MLLLFWQWIAEKGSHSDREYVYIKRQQSHASKCVNRICFFQTQTQTQFTCHNSTWCNILQGNMLKKILLAALTFSAITLSSAVGPGDGSNNNNDDEDPIVGEMFEELKYAGNNFRDLACSTCDQLINLAELPMNTFVSIEASRGIDIESEIFQARRIVFSRLVSWFEQFFSSFFFSPFN